MNPRILAARYIAFAILATIANLAVQRLMFTSAASAMPIPPTARYCVALIGGTLVGLITKYILDKRWIFHDDASGIVNHGKQFSLYGLMGLATTAIFWGFESFFWLLWHAQSAREIGAVIGLSVGYFVKYRLDRRFVFASNGGKLRSAAR